MNLLHGLACLLHRRQRLPVDIRRLDRVDLLFQRPYLRLCLLLGVLVGLLALQRCLGRYCSLSALFEILWAVMVARRTVLVGVDVFPCNSILLIDL